MLDKQDQVIQKIDHMETSITGEIKDLRTDLRSYLDRKFSAVEQRYPADQNKDRYVVTIPRCSTVIQERKTTGYDS